MRNPLNKRLPREFKKNASKYIGIFLILVCTIVVVSTFWFPSIALPIQWTKSIKNAKQMMGTLKQ